MDLKGSPALDGYRMPAEWETHSQCWMGWPVSTSGFNSPVAYHIIVFWSELWVVFFSVWEMGSVPGSCCMGNPINLIGFLVICMNPWCIWAFPILCVSMLIVKQMYLIVIPQELLCLIWMCSMLWIWGYCNSFHMFADFYFILSINYRLVLYMDFVRFDIGHVFCGYVWIVY